MGPYWESTRCPIHRPQPRPQPFRFFALPPEIRQQIITHVVTDPFPITIKWKGFNRHVKTQRQIHTGPSMSAPEQLLRPNEEPSDEELCFGHSRIALLMTCKQAYGDGWKIYYGKNTFDFTLDIFKPFCDEVPSRCRNQIRSIHFKMPSRYYHDMIWQMLATFAKLENLEVQLHAPSTAQVSEWENCQSGVKKIKRLQTLRLWRAGCSGERILQDLVVLEKDREIQDEINAYLRERKREREREQMVSWGKKGAVVKAVLSQRTSD